MPPIAQAILATLLVSAVSLIGVVFFFGDWRERRAMVFVSFAAGVLLATTFLELLPEAMRRRTGEGNIFMATLAAMAAFFVLERFLHGFHGHHEHERHAHERHVAASSWLILIGDSLHNFIDGVVIAATFLVNPALGVATTVAVAAHEIPQEIADFGILLNGRFSRTTALVLNFASGLFAVLGALCCWWLEGVVERHLAWFMAAAAGMFIYIAASDLLPELHHTSGRQTWLYAVPFFFGALLIALLGVIIPGAH
jgi:zinc and cadmium transporter